MKTFATIFFIVFEALFTSLAAQNNNGLILQMLFNGDTKDQSRYNNTGTKNGGVFFGADRFGCPCGAVQFNGYDAYISVPSSKSLESPGNEITIAAWVKMNAGADNKKWLTICCKGDGITEDSFCPQYRLQGTMVTLSLNTSFTENLNISMNFDQWYHYAMTYNGSIVSLYLDGSFVFSYAYAGQLRANKMPLEIGRDVPGVLEYFNGSIDDLRIYNRALNASQIATIYRDDSEKTSLKPCTKKVIPPHPPTPPVTTSPVIPSSPTQSGNPPAILLLPPFSDPKRVEVSNRSVEVIAKVLNVSTDHQIVCKLNGDNQTFEFDPNTHLLKIPTLLNTGENAVEIYATNQYGNASKMTVINLLSVQQNAQAIPNLQGIHDPLNRQSALLKDENIEVTQTIKIPSSKIKITCYDYQKFDGDTVTIMLNNIVLFDHICLQPKANTAAVKEVQLRAGAEYLLIVKSINEGSLPTNTLKIEITDDSGFRKEFILNSKKGTSQALKFIYST